MFFGRHYPTYRSRRLREKVNIRDIIRETNLTPQHLIYPVFVSDIAEACTPIAGMPGISRLSTDDLLRTAEKSLSLGVNFLAIFPFIPAEKKSPDAKEALNPDSLMIRTIRLLKDNFPELGVIADIALDPYTHDGHDGISTQEGWILNDLTVEILTQQAMLYAQAGVDCVAPSDMMDGRIGAIRKALEDTPSCRYTKIISYAAKYASQFYSPFRTAVTSNQPKESILDKRNYQIDPANVLEALHEVAADIHEGADIIIVKPASMYLDVIHRIKSSFAIPIFAYQVSGEYSMLKTAILNEYLPKDAILETLIACRRAGADGILTYFALEAAYSMTT